MNALAPSLAGLAQEIQRHHAATMAAAGEALEHARRAGTLLLEAKEQLAHGEWLPWLAENVAIPERTAQAYMRVASHWDELSKSATVADLPLRGALALLAEPRESPVNPAALQTDDPEDVIAWTENRFAWLKEHQPAPVEFRERIRQSTTVQEANALRWEAAYWMLEFEEVELRETRAYGQIALRLEGSAELCLQKGPEPEWEALAVEVLALAKAYWEMASPRHAEWGRIRTLAEADGDAVNEWILRMKDSKMQITLNRAYAFARSRQAVSRD